MPAAVCKKEVLTIEASVRFETAPDLISGIELIATGQKIAWNIADYLVSLEKSVGELLKTPSRPEPRIP